MSTSSLIPDRQIVFSAELAATLGLEEAVLLQCLSDESEGMEAEVSGHYQWYVLNAAQLKKRLPFWQETDIQNISENLRQQGVILISSAPVSESKELRYAFNESATSQQNAPTATLKATLNPGKEILNGTNFVPRAMPITDRWQPSASCIKQLSQHNIPRHFFEQRVTEFVFYWKERGESHMTWDNKFFKLVMREWRNYEARKQPAPPSLFDSPPWELPNRQEYSPENNGKAHVETKAAVLITKDWCPSQDTLDYLTIYAGINNEFIQDCIPEFILFWQEKGSRSQIWNNQFAKHVKHQWESFNHNLKHDNKQTAISKNWLPSDECYTTLQYAGVDIAFAEKLIPEFIMYWTHRNELRLNWDNIFYKVAKKEWAEHKNKPKESIRETSFRDRLNDQTW